MDMKRLKNNMWDLLTDGQRKQIVTEVSVGGEPDSPAGPRIREPPVGNCLTPTETVLGRLSSKSFLAALLLWMDA